MELDPETTNNTLGIGMYCIIFDGGGGGGGFYIKFMFLKSTRPWNKAILCTQSTESDPLHTLQKKSVKCRFPINYLINWREYFMFKSIKCPMY